MRPLLTAFAAAMLLLTGCSANGSSNAYSSEPSPAAASASSAILAESTPTPPSNPFRDLQPEQIASVEIAHVPLGDERLEPLLPSSDSDKAVISSLVEWVRDAKPFNPAFSDGEEARPQTWAVLHTNDGDSLTVNQICSYKDNGAAVDCHESDGWVSATLGDEEEPTFLQSADLGAWLGGLYRADVTTVLQNSAPRAIGRTADGGRLQLLPTESERYRKLGVMSCLGGEDDYRLTGNYEMQYVSSDGTVRKVDALSNLALVQPSLNPVTLESIDFGSFTAFLFAPEYTGCHGIDFRLFGVQDGSAFPFVFRMEDGSSRATFNMTNAPGAPKPQAVEGNLVIEMGPEAGMDHPIRYTFRPDLQKQEMRLTNQEVISSS